MPETLQATEEALQRAGLDPDQLYRVEPTADRLGISRAKAFQMIKDGELASIKIGGSRRVPGWAILRIVRAGRDGEVA